jgi:hypothetical protein
MRASQRSEPALSLPKGSSSQRSNQFAQGEICPFDESGLHCAREAEGLGAVAPLLALARSRRKPEPPVRGEAGEVVTQAIRTEDGDVVRSEALLEAMDKGEGIIDQAATDVDMRDDFGDRINGCPDEGALGVAADGTHEFVELQESTVQMVKEQIMEVGGVEAGAVQPAADGAMVMMEDTCSGGRIQAVGEQGGPG